MASVLRNLNQKYVQLFTNMSSQFIFIVNQAFLFLHKTHGVTNYGKDKATSEYTLYSRDRFMQVWLINMEGKVVHEWKSSGETTNFNYLLPDGNLLICERVPKGLKFNPEKLVWPFYKRYGIDWKNLINRGSSFAW